MGFLTDSITAASLLNTGTSASKALRSVGEHFASLARSAESHWAAVHVPGTTMEAWGVDALSRLGTTAYHQRALTNQAVGTIAKSIGGPLILIGSTPHPPAHPSPRMLFASSVAEAHTQLKGAPRQATTAVLCPPPHTRIDECSAALAAGFKSVIAVCPVMSIAGLCLHFNVSRLNVREWTKSAPVLAKGLPPQDVASIALSWPKDGAYDLCRISRATPTG